MTVGELEHGRGHPMTSAELTEWMAVDMYYEPLASPWRQAGTIAAASLAPHCKRGQAPKVEDFVPVARRRQTPEEMQAELAKLASIKFGGKK